MSLVEEFPEKAHDFRQLRKLALGRVALDSGYDQSLVEPAFAVFDEARNNVELYPEVETELATLAEHFVLVAVTNGNADLHRIGIAQHFRAIVTSVEVGVAKPAAPIFDEAILRTGIAAAQTIHVGDHPDTDITGAQNAGMRTAWVNRIGATWPDHLDAPDATIQTMTDLRELLQPAISAAGR